MRPDVRDLECFVAAAEELHFRRAAKRIGLSQPALSQRIQRLEDGLGVALFDRTAKGVTRTPAAEVFLGHAQALLRQLDEAVEAARATMRPVEHRLVMGHRDYVRLPWFPGVIHRLLQGAEPVLVEHRELDARAIERGLLERTLDIGLVANDVDAHDLVLRPLQSGRWVLVVPEDHASPVDRPLPVGALAEEQLIMFLRSGNPVLYDVLIDTMRSAGGFEPRVVYQTGQLASGPEMVRSGIGSFVVASYLLEQVPPGTRALVIDGLPPVSVSFAWHVDNRSPALRLFRHALDEALPRRGIRDERWSPSSAQGTR